MSNTNIPAFPTEYRDDPRQPCAEGMTLRDYFAAKALWGVLNESQMTQKQMAEWSYEVADEMLKARQE